MKKSLLTFGIVPSIIALSLFYSLAIHMYLSLGGWPESIGEEGFSAFLIIHAYISVYFFGFMFLLVIFISPIALLLCLIIKKWRKRIPYWIVNAVSFGLCFLFIKLAPSGFLYWWWD